MPRNNSPVERTVVRRTSVRITDKQTLNYRRVLIPKRGGKTREILIATKAERARLKEQVVPVLNDAQMYLCGEEVHGFMPGRNPVTNALCHIGYEFTLSVDLSNFFDTVIPQMVRESGLEPDIREFPHGTAAQGLPTSPAWANIAATRLDKMILTELATLEKEFDTKVVYTRYADDLSFSSNCQPVLMKLKGTTTSKWHPERKETPSMLAEMVGLCGFQINTRKTRLQWAGKDGSWAREITGVSVVNKPKDFHAELINFVDAQEQAGNLTAKEAGRIRFWAKKSVDMHIVPQKHIRRRLKELILTSKDSKKTKGMIQWANCQVPKKERKPMAELEDYIDGIRMFFGPGANKERIPYMSPEEKKALKRKKKKR